MARRRLIWSVMAVAAASAAACVGLVWARSPDRDGRVKALEAVMAKLGPLHTRLGKPEPGDWLSQHREPGQSFRQYVRSRPVIPDRKRRAIYVQPLGEFTKGQREIVKLTAEFLGLYFNLPVKVKDDLPLSIIPAKARRTHPSWGDKQILSTYVLDDVLRPRLPSDAFAMIAFTASDLWPGKGWNFVFGQASLRQRVGVWSIYRFGDPAKSDETRRRCLLRTMRTGSHEIGHMFSMLHCTAYECNMCGSNSLGESDRRPLALCPHCLGKLCWATGADPADRYRKLAAFCKSRKLDAEARFYERSLRALGAAPATSRASR